MADTNSIASTDTTKDGESTAGAGTETPKGDAGASAASTDTTKDGESTAGGNESTRTEWPAEAKAALHNANKEAEKQRLKVKEYEDRDKTAEQKLQEERDALKTENERLKVDGLRREVAAEKGIDPKAAKYLQGTTREELEAAATELVEVLKPGKPVFGDVGQGEGKGNGAAGRIYTEDELHDHAFYLANKEDILRAQREGRIRTT